MGLLDKFRTTDGKRLRSPEEFIRAQGDDPVCKVRIYNNRDKIVMEAWKNMKTKRTHITKLRRPTSEEEKHFTRLIQQQKWMEGKDNQDQCEVVISGDKYEKKKLESQK